MNTASEPQSSVYLVVPEPQGEQQVWLDQGNIWWVGRAPENDVVLSDDSVSRNHAFFQRNNSGEYYLFDMGSSNGSFVNGARVRVPRSLKDGDQIHFGDIVLTFRYCHAATGETPPATTQQLIPPAPELPKSEQTHLTFRQHLITVLVVDVRDFTKLTQEVEQRVLCNAIGTWFRNGGRIMQDHGSWSLKYIGDAIMAVWLHQNGGHEQDEIMGALKAYMELADSSANLASEFSLPYAFRFGAGINTGLASIGNTGAEGLSDFTAMGDVVNAAFRIESATKETGVDVAIGRDTFKFLQQCFHPDRYFRPYRVHLKGYDSPTDVWGATVETAQRFVAGEKTNATP